MEGLRKNTRRQTRAFVHQGDVTDEQEEQVPFEGHHSTKAHRIEEDEVKVVSEDITEEQDEHSEQEEGQALPTPLRSQPDENQPQILLGQSQGGARPKVFPERASYQQAEQRERVPYRPDLESQHQAEHDLVAALNRNQEMVASVAARARQRHLNLTRARPRTVSPQAPRFRPNPSPPLTREVLQEAIDIAVRNTIQSMGNPARDQDGVQPPRSVNRDFTQRTTQGQARATASSSYSTGGHTRSRTPARRWPSQESSDEDDQSVRSSRSVTRSQYSPKLPPFSGKEKWEVWFARFSDVARLHGWGERRCLQELLPRLQGTAGDFVYAQLPAEARSSYGRLINELNSRFRVVETRKTFAAQFSARNQKPGETVEDYAAELKRLYNKAYPGRDQDTRKEDLLRRFLDGLLDERTRFHIEFVKEPDSIDQAVFEVVNFTETRRRPREKESSSRFRPTRAVRNYASSDSEEDGAMVQPADDESDSEPERVARVPSRANRHKKLKMPGDQAQPSKVQGNSEQSQQGQEMGKILSLLETLISAQTETQGQVPESVKNVKGKANQPRGEAKDRRCFKCGEEGHFAKECPSRVSNGSSKSRSYSARRSCYKCGEEGHFGKDCPQYRWVQVPISGTDTASAIPESSQPRVNNGLSDLSN